MTGKFSLTIHDGHLLLAVGTGDAQVPGLEAPGTPGCLREPGVSSRYWRIGGATTGLECQHVLRPGPRHGMDIRESYISISRSIFWFAPLSFLNIASSSSTLPAAPAASKWCA